MQDRIEIKDLPVLEELKENEVKGIFGGTSTADLQDPIGNFNFQVEIHGLGRNPKTGETMQIAAPTLKY